MGTTREGTKSRILNESRRLIAQNGYAAVSMSDIAGAVGIRKSSIYNHFAAKQDILATLMIDHLEKVVSLAEQCLVGIDAIDQQLCAFARFHVIYHVDFPEDVFLAYMELRSLEEGPEKNKVVLLRRKYEGILKKILKDGVVLGEFNIADIDVHCRAILAMLTGVTVWYQPDACLSKSAVAEVYVQAVLHGVSEQRNSAVH